MHVQRTRRIGTQFLMFGHIYAIQKRRAFHNGSAMLVEKDVAMLAHVYGKLASKPLLGLSVSQRIYTHAHGRRPPLVKNSVERFEQNNFPHTLARADRLEPKLAGLLSHGS